MKLYRIKDWSANFENHDTRKLAALRFVLVPNKHDGLTFRRMAREKNAAELFGAWVLIVQIASKTDKLHRGELIRDGVPLDASDLSLMTGFSEAVFEKALKYFSQPSIGWLEAQQFETELALTPGIPPATAPGSIPVAPVAIPEPPDNPPLNEGRKEENEGTIAPPAKPVRARNELFDSLAAVSGADPKELTHDANKACGVALAQIKAASPAVTPDEIKHRAENYRTHFDNAALTPNALAKHWATCGKPSARRGQSSPKPARTNFPTDDYTLPART